jgi:probable F420-dependent oxidoreductase
VWLRLTAGDSSRLNPGVRVRIGVVFPQTELGGDVGAVRAYGERVQELGFAHVLAYDHVVGADPDVHRGWRGPYDVSTTFHEPFVLFGYLAAVTSLELVTGIIILPQRQTVLAAKQAAEVDLLTDGHFRLGVGIGWNAVEYEALGKDFSNRGERLEEQVVLLRRLWTERTVTHEGVHERVTGAGVVPLPLPRLTPGWFGAVAERALRRVGRLADGWFPQVPPGPKLDEARAIVRGAAVDAGRDPDALGMEGRISWDEGDVDRLVRQAGRWRDADATHLSVNTMGAGLGSVEDHLAALAKASEALAPLNP